MKQDTIVILHNIRSAHNVGSIFRTADGAGVAKIYLTGYAPAPIDRFGRVVPEIQKTSLGATESIEWEHGVDIVLCMEQLRTQQYNIAAVEQTPQSVPYDVYIPTKSTAYIFGNEVEGVPKDVSDMCDVVIDIPMVGKKESLNVAVSAGVILYQDLRQKDSSSPA